MIFTGERNYDELKQFSPAAEQRTVSHCQKQTVHHQLHLHCETITFTEHAMRPPNKQSILEPGG